MTGRVATSWGLVWLCIGAGIVSALQIGKAPPVILEIQADLGLDKITAGWVISLISAVGMTIAAFVGVLAGVLGAKRVHLSGYLLIALGSGLGMTADSGSFLLFSRLVESLGFLAIIVSAPPLLQRVIARADLGRVMGFWGCYMPGGMVIALVAAPTLAGLVGWRGLWAVLAGVTLLWGLLVLWRMPADPSDARARPNWSLVISAFWRPRSWLLPVIFCVYNIQWMSVMGWLPSVLEDGFGQTGQAAALLTAVPIAVNACVNLVAGRLMHGGVPRWGLIMFASLVMAGSATGIFNSGLAPEIRFALVVLFGGIGGLIPASLFAMAPRVVAEPAQLGVINGLLIQGSNLGHVIGPPMAAAVATAYGGWNASIWLMLAAAAAAILLAAILRPIERGTA
ncbi:MAG: MFS transporter [Rhodospirillales bacterium]